MSLILLAQAANAFGETSTKAAFMEAYRTAHTNRDVDALMKLVYWEGVEEDIKKNFAKNFKDELKLEIENLEMLQPSSDEMTQYTIQGRTYKTNLTVTDVLIIHFKAQPGIAQITHTKYLVGVKEGGQYCITTAMPIDTQAPGNA